MAFFTGEHDTQIGAKRRLAICSALREKIRSEDGHQWYLVLGLNMKLWLYPDEQYMKLATSLEQSLLPSEEDEAMDIMFAFADLLKPDAQGRVVLPEKSLRRAGMSDVKDVVLAGKRDHIEIWPAEEWEAEAKAKLEQYQETLRRARRATRTAGQERANDA